MSKRNEMSVDYDQLQQELSALQVIAHKFNVSISDVIQLKLACEMERSNNLYANKGEAFSDLFLELNGRLKDLYHAISEFRLQ